MHAARGAHCVSAHVKRSSGLHIKGGENDESCRKTGGIGFGGLSPSTTEIMRSAHHPTRKTSWVSKQAIPLIVALLFAPLIERIVGPRLAQGASR